MSNLLIHDNENIIIYADDLIKDIDEDFFDPRAWLDDENTNVLSSGRGEAIIFECQNQSCVLKHYHRGGIIGDYIKDRYLWTGMNGARSIREYNRLNELSTMNLPVPKPIAARVKKLGFDYTADLITMEIQNSTTLSELISADAVTKDVWEAVGNCLRLFNEKGVYHPDLNTNNILVDQQLSVYLIDFDSAFRLQERIASPKKTLNRFHRSLKKIHVKNKKEFLKSDWDIIVSNCSAS